MKSIKTKFAKRFRLIACSPLLIASSVQAATYYWDNNHTAAGFGDAGGTWAQNSTSGGTSARWKTDATGVLAGSATRTTTNADIFNFGTDTLSLGAGTITVSNAVTMGDTFFGAASGAVVLSGGTINFGAAKTITVHNATNTIDSVIGGAATSLSKAGIGTLSLTGTNTYIGSTIIHAGAIDLGGGSATGSLDSTVLTLAGGSLHYSRTGNTTQSFTTTNINSGGTSQVSAVSGNILNLGTIVRGAGGSLDFANVGAGAVAAHAANNDATGIIPSFSHGNSWAVANDPGLAISALPSGAYTLSSIALNAASNYTGLNIDINSSQSPDAGITANSLRFNNNAAMTLTLQGTNIVSSGGILIGSAIGANLTTLTGGTLAGSDTKDLHIIQNNTSSGLILNSVIADNTGATGLTKSGAGLLSLGNSNTFTGGVFINGGQLTLAHPGALNNSDGLQNAVTVASGGTLTLNGNSVVIRSLANLPTSPSPALVENASSTPVTFTIGNSGNASSAFGGVIQDGIGSGNLTLEKIGTGVLTLSGPNTYTGGTVINGGTLSIRANHNLGAATTAITVNGASRINSTATSNVDYTRPISLNAGSILTLQNTGPANSTATFSGAITGDGDIAQVAGSVNGNVSISLSNPNNTFSGNITLPSTGSNNDFLAFASIGDAGLITIGKGTWRSVAQYIGSSDLILANRQLALGSSFGANFDGNGNPVQAIQVNGSGTLRFNADMVVASGRTGTFWFDGSNSGNNTFAGNIPNSSGGTLSIGKFGSGKWRLTNANTFIGNVTIANGILSVDTIDVSANAQPLGNGSSIQFGDKANTGTLEYTGSANSTIDRQIVIGSSANANNSHSGSGVIQNNGTGSLTFTNPAFNAQATGIGANRVITLSGTYDGSNGPNEIQGTIQNNAGASTFGVGLSVYGSIWKLSGTNSYAGNTTINSGVLEATDGSSLPSASGILQLRGGVFQSSGTFTRNVNATAGAGGVNWGTSSGGFAAKGAPFIINLNGGTASLTWNGSSFVPTGSILIFNSTTADNLVDFQNSINLGSSGTNTRTITVIDNPNSANDRARISGNLTNTTAGQGLIKNGDGTLELTGTNTYTGATSVTQGTLALIGGSQASPINVSSTASLGFTLGSPSTSTASVDLTTCTVRITGSPTLSSHTLMTLTGGANFSGAATLNPTIPGYQLTLANANTELQLNSTNGSSPYNTWSNGPLADVDTNGDGVKNGVAWALGATSPTDTSFELPTFDNTGDPSYAIFTFDRSDTAFADPNTTIIVEYDTDLTGPWTPAVHDGSNVIIEITPGSPSDSVKVKLNRNTLAPHGKIFARLNVVVMP